MGYIRRKKKEKKKEERKEERRKKRTRRSILVTKNRLVRVKMTLYVFQSQGKPYRGSIRNKTRNRKKRRKKNAGYPRPVRSLVNS